MVGKRIVLTGGASQLTGLGELARRILARNVRLGRPLGVSGMPEAGKGPAFAAAVGLMIYPQMAHLENYAMQARRLRCCGLRGPAARFRAWEIG